jgi:hypothetical protein
VPYPARVTDTPEPASVVAARKGVDQFHKRLGIYLGGIGVSVLALLGTAVAGGPPEAMGPIMALYVAWALGGVAWMRPQSLKQHRHVVQEWESRALREEFARFDSAAAGADDPRLEVAASMVRRIRALDSSPASTDEMVTRLEARLARLVTDQTAAAAAVTALEAAGAGAEGTGRLRQAAIHLDEEIARILAGLSDLYAALLESGTTGEAAALGDVMAWLQAEAEIARASQAADPAAEAMRPARGAKVSDGR